MKNISKNLLCAISIALLISSALIPDAYACTEAYFGITWNKNVDLTDLSIQMCSSNFFLDSTVNSSMYAWNDISSNICVTRYTSSTKDIETDDANINFHEAELTGTLAGLTHWYRKNIFGQYVEISDDDLDSNYTVSQVRIDLSPKVLTLPDRYRYSVVVHELGHALLLKHPIKVGCTINAIMQTEESKRAVHILTPHDKNNLIKKWGN